MSVDLAEVTASSGGSAVNTDTVLTAPAALAANSGGIGDMLLLFVGVANSTNAAPAVTGTGWAQVPKLGGGVADYYGGSGTWGPETGPRGCSVWWKVSNGTDGATIANGGSGTDRSMRCSMLRVGNGTATGWAAPVAVGGTDTSTGSAFAVAPGSTPGGASGDAVFAGGAWVPSTVNTSGSVASSITWPGAVATGACVQRATGAIASNGTTGGVRLMTYSAPVSGSDTGNLSFALTMLSSVYGGAAAMVRLRTTGVAPVANAGGDQVNVEPGSTVVIEGGLSTGNIDTWDWQQTAGTDVEASWTGPDSSRTFVVPATLAGETLTFTLQVTDVDAVVSNVDTINVEVMEPTGFAFDAGVLVPVLSYYWG